MHKGELIPLPEHKLITLEQAIEIRKTLGGLLVVLTTGTYDYPSHYLHLQYLASSRALGDKLFVACDSDQYVVRRKGDKRPLAPYWVRAITLALLDYVDYLFPHEGDDIGLVKALQPSFYVQSEATTQESVAKKKPIFDEAEKYGRVVMMPIENQLGISTSTIRRLIKEDRKL